MGRITKIYPGNDGLVRVVKVEMRGKVYKRPVGKLSRLPIDTEEIKNKKELEPDEVIKSHKKKSKKVSSGIKNGTIMTKLAFLMLITMVFGNKTDKNMDIRQKMQQSCHYQWHMAFVCGYRYDCISQRNRRVA